MPQSTSATAKPVQHLLQPRLRRPAGGRFLMPVGSILAAKPRRIAQRPTHAPVRRSHTGSFSPAMELVCRADSPAALRAMVGNGADCVHLDYVACPERQSGQSSRVLMCDGIRYAHDNGCKAVIELNMQSTASTWEECRNAIDIAAEEQVDAIIASDPALLLYASANHPDIQLHCRVSDPAALSDASTLRQKQFGISRVLLPRQLSLRQAEQLSVTNQVELEILGFGMQCAIVEGRRSAASDEAHGGMIGLGEALRSAAFERCVADEHAANDSCYASPARPDIGALGLLPRLKNIGVRAIRIEAPGGNPTKAARITRVWRDAIDSCLQDPARYAVKPAWIAQLSLSVSQPGRCKP